MPGEICSILAALAASLLVAVVEELVAGCAETLPDLLALLARNGAYLLPLLLELHEFLGGLLPLLAVLQGLCLLAEGDLLIHVLLHLILELGVEQPLLGEEVVAGGTETVVYLLVLLLGGESDGTPLLLDIFKGRKDGELCATGRL